MIVPLGPLSDGCKIAVCVGGGGGGRACVCVMRVCVCVVCLCACAVEVENGWSKRQRLGVLGYYGSRSRL